MSYLGDLGAFLKGERDGVTLELDNKLNAVAPYSGYLAVSKKLDNFYFKTSSNFIASMADKNRYVKFSDKVVDTYGQELISKDVAFTLSTGVTALEQNRFNWTSSTNNVVYQNRVSTTAGKVYAISFTIEQYISGALQGRIGNARGTDLKNSVGRHTVYVVSDTFTLIGLEAETTFVGIVSNISVREIQSVNLSNYIPETLIQNEATNGLTLQTSVNAGDYVVLNRKDLVTNGTFSTDTDWSYNDNGVVISSPTGHIAGGVATIYSTGTFQAFNQYIGNTSNAQYVIQFDVTRVGSGAIKVAVAPVESGAGGLELATNISTVGRHTVKVSSTYGWLIIGRVSACDIDIDNVSVKRVDETYRAKRNTADMYDYRTDAGGTVSFTPSTVFKAISGYFTSGTADHYYKRIDGVSGTLTLSSQSFGNTAVWLDLGTAENMSLLNPYFEVRDNIGVTNQIGIFHKYNLLTDSYEGLSAEILFSDVSKEDLLDNPVWLSRNGFSKAGEYCYSKGTYLYLPVSIWQSLNKGAYHPVFNWFGTKFVNNTVNSDGSVWYNSSFAVPLTSYYQSFYLTNAVGQAGMPFGNTGGSVLNGTSLTGRPDVKYYDIVYPDQFTDVREYAKVLNKWEVDLICRDKEENGVDEVIWTYESDSTIGYTLSYVYIYNLNRNIGEYIVYHYNDGTNYIYGRGRVYEVVGSEYRVTKDVVFTNMTSGSYYTITNVLLTKTKPVLSSGTKLSTDLIGNPVNYPQIMKDRLAEGKGITGVNPLLVSDTGVNLLPDGTAINTKFSKKVISKNSLIATADGGVSYADITTNVNYYYGSSNFSFITNSGFATAGYALSNRVSFASYTSKNNPYTQTTPKSVVEVLPKVKASNSHSIYKGALVGNQVSGKIQVGNGANGYESKVLENADTNIIYNRIICDGATSVSLIIGEYYQVFGNIFVPNGWTFKRGISNTTTTYASTSSAFIDNPTYYIESSNITTIPIHNTLALDNSNSPASKWFECLEEGNNGVLAGVYGKELVWDYAKDTWSEYGSLYATSSSQTYTDGVVYQVNDTSSALYGVYVQSIGTFTNSTYPWNNAYIDNNGIIQLYNTAGYENRFRVWDGNGFGDNELFDQLTNGFKTDLNGATVRTFHGSIAINGRIK